MRLMLELLTRFCKTPDRDSFFLFGPRGTGKTQFLRQKFPGAIFVNLLLPSEFAKYSANPESLIALVAGVGSQQDNNLPSIVIDEVQKVPALLSVVHDLLEKPQGKNLRFILTGSSSRKLKTAGADLLAGRAHTIQFHPFMATELDRHWDLERALEIGTLPVVWNSEDASNSLQSYIGTYLREEVLQERLVRNLGNFSRFLEVMSFSQGSSLNISAMGRECQIEQKTAEGFVELIEDLLIGSRLSVFQKRAKRELSTHPKFYYFDTGVYRSLRPTGPLDTPENIAGIALETLVYQHLRAWISIKDPKLTLSYWRTRSGVEVDFVVYGKEEFIAIEVKNSNRIRTEDLRALRTFAEDYPESKQIFLYRGAQREMHHDILCLPIDDFFKNLDPRKPNRIIQSS